MRVAIVTEEYRDSVDRGSFFEVREILSRFYPEAVWFTVRAKEKPRTFWKSWRMAMKVENIDLRGFDMVISLGHGFVHGVITQLRTVHTSYLISVPSLWHEPGWVGHWYRLWSFARSAQVEHWIAASPDVAEYLAGAWRIKEVSQSKSVGEFKKYIQGIIT